ncbi:hypothetical protein FACS189472_18280 [Alphaproteobacteria bacterium]|nr:hypothetical protein FACS189472_18280 [Alphaproteobacteria bacterium]
MLLRPSPLLGLFEHKEWEFVFARLARVDELGTVMIPETAAALGDFDKEDVGELWNGVPPLSLTLSGERKAGEQGEEDVKDESDAVSNC